MTPKDEIKSRLDIASVIGGYVKLERAGANLKARCPFHTERTPSFHVSPARQSFHCFGCGKGGDIFTFVSEMEGVDFRGALHILAERAGVSLKEESREDRTHREELFAAIEDATLFFERERERSREARDYIVHRGILPKTVERFRIGYAPDTWSHLCDFLRSRKHTDEVIEKAGLAVPGPRGLYDRFRGRLMFPIRDITGRVIGFSGRILIPDEKSAKYINSPESELYEKSKILFGMYEAKHAIRKEGRVILVEGQVDLVLSHQSGVEHAIAVSGTALTEQHLEMLKRYASTLLLAFDGDPAGIKAGKRSIILAIEQGIETKIISLPEARDPADIAQESPELWRTIANQSSHVIEYLLSLIEKRIPHPRERGKEIEQDIVPLVALLSSPVDRAYYVQLIARSVGVSEDPIWELVRKTQFHTKPNSPTRAPISVSEKRSTIEEIERELHGHAERNPELKQRIEDQFVRIRGIDTYQASKTKYESIIDQLVILAEKQIQQGDDEGTYLAGLFERLETESLSEELREMLRLIREAEERGDTSALEQATKEYEIKQRKLQELRNLKAAKK